MTEGLLPVPQRHPAMCVCQFINVDCWCATLCFPFAATFVATSNMASSSETLVVPFELHFLQVFGY